MLYRHLNYRKMWLSGAIGFGSSTPTKRALTINCQTALGLVSSHSQYKMMKVAAFAAMVATAAAGAVELSPATFDEEVISSGKGAFVKFLAPW